MAAGQGLGQGGGMLSKMRHRNSRQHNHDYYANNNNGNNGNNGDVDTMLANDLQQMSFTERELLYEEIHGVDEWINETPDLVTTKLIELDIELTKINVKVAYEEALNINPTYIQSPKFRLMFLRAERFEVQQTAKRLVLFCEEKKRLFGSHTLGRPLQYNDLDTDTQKTLHAGVYQWCGRDRSGRAIFLNLQQMYQPNGRPYKDAINMVKMFMYFTLSLVEDDEETQKKGVACVFYFMSPNPVAFDSDLHSQMPRTMDWLPFRIVSIHYCSPNKLSPLLKNIVSVMTKRIRLRVKFHGGTHTECQYSLLTFGLPMNSLPVNYEGEIKNQNHLKWISKMKFRDEYRRRNGISSEFCGIDLPGTDDVLLGRGRIFQDHSGSVRLRRIVDSMMSQYVKASKHGKTDVTWMVVNKVKEGGGRFLKRDDKKFGGWWIPVPDDDARTKVGMSFRTALSVKSRSSSSLSFGTTTTTASILNNGGGSSSSTSLLTNGHPREQEDIQPTTLSSSNFVEFPSGKRARVAAQVATADIVGSSTSGSNIDMVLPRFTNNGNKSCFGFCNSPNL